MVSNVLGWRLTKLHRDIFSCLFITNDYTTVILLDNLSPDILKICQTDGHAGNIRWPSLTLIALISLSFKNFGRQSLRAREEAEDFRSSWIVEHPRSVFILMFSIYRKKYFIYGQIFMQMYMLIFVLIMLILLIM